MSDKIKQFKLSTGEEIICEVVQWDTAETSGLIIRSAMKLSESVNIKSGYRFFSFKPWLSFNEEPRILLTLNSDHIMGETSPSKELLKMYISCLRKLNKWLDEREIKEPIDLDGLSDLTDEELHEYLEENLEDLELIEDEVPMEIDSDVSSNIIKFPKSYH